MGHIIQISVSRGGLPKRSIPEGLITPLGIEGDLCAHPEIHGGQHQAVLLIAAEAVHELVERGYPVSYGALGENLTTRGLDRRQLRPGQRLREFALPAPPSMFTGPPSRRKSTTLASRQATPRRRAGA